MPPTISSQINCIGIDTSASVVYKFKAGYFEGNRIFEGLLSLLG